MFDLAINRLSYSELLQPDAGYTLRFAVGMTYSLNLEALLGVPVSLGLLDDLDEVNMRNPLCVLEAIRKSSDSIALFCNAGGIKLPNKIQSVYSLLENSVFQIKLDKDSNFHPKIWVLKYSGEEKPDYIRLLVMSRNLTFDSSIDIAISMQGIVGSEKHEKNRPLADFLRFAAESAEKKKRDVLSLADDVEKVAAFEVDKPFVDYDFYPIGIPGYPGDQLPLFRKKYDLFIASPFLTDDTILKIKKEMPPSGRSSLVTRKSSVTPKVLECFDHVYVTKDVLSDNEFGAKQDIHAKIYYTSTYDANYLYIGSANASYNAFNRNVECLLRLRYKLWAIGFKTFVEDFIPPENCPYEEITSVPEIQAEDKRKDEIEKALHEAAFALKKAYISEEKERYTVLVKAKSLKTEEKVEIAPLQRKDLICQWKTEVEFSGLLLKELSEFYILRVDSTELVVKVETKGMPKDRDQEIYRSIIDSKPKFMNYLAFMLSGDLAQGFSENESMEDAVLGSSATNDNGYNPTAAVYEQMLRVFHQNPKKLHEIKQMIRQLDPGVVGNEFQKMLDQFIAAEKVRK